MDQEPQYSNQNPKRISQLNKFAQPEIKVGAQKYMSMSSTLRKVKALERNKDFKRERMFLMPKQVRESIKTMKGASGVHLPRKPVGIVDHEERLGSRSNTSLVDVSSCCFSEEILAEDNILKAN